MGYLSINNLYKEPDLFLFKELYALEKIHGTSAHLSYSEGKLHYFSGGEKHEKFKALFAERELVARFEKLGHPSTVVFGEAYGGAQQQMGHTYGPDLKFIVFDVKVRDIWVTVPNAKSIAAKLGLEFVDYHKVPAELEALDKIRTAPSAQAKRNGIIEDKEREGIVVRPLIELSRIEPPHG